MAIRFDRAVIESPKSKPYITEDGTLLVEGTFARDGILIYTDALGRTRREFRPPEENKKALTTFGLVPITDEHPNGLVTDDNSSDLRKGMTLQNVWYGKGGFVKGQVAIFDSVMRDEVLSGKNIELSAGYRCDVDETPGSWTDPDGETYRYDAVQRNIRVNHVARTKRGRAGEDVKLHVDSSDDPDVAFQIDSIASIANSNTTQGTNKRMAKLKVGNVEYPDVPEVVASVFGQKLDALTTAEAEIIKKDSAIAELQEKLDGLEDEVVEERNRADRAELYLDSAEELLGEFGYKRDAEDNYIKVDTSDKKKDKKGKMPPWMSEEDESDEDDLDDEEEVDPKKSKKKKDMSAKKEDMDKKKDGSYKKMDSEEERSDAKTVAKQLMAAWKEADSLVVRGDSEQSFSDEHFDSAETAADVRKLVVANLRPNLKLDGKSAETIDALYEVLKEDASQTEEKQDAATPNYSRDMSIAISRARQNNGGKSPIDQAQAKRSEETANAHEQPLSLSR